MKRLAFLPAAIWLLAAPTLAAPAAPAGEIAVICDQDVAPYRALVQGFTDASAAAVRVIPAAEAAVDGLEGRLRRAGVRAVLAVGVQARDAVEAVRELPVLLAMAPQVEHWVAARPNRLGIEMALSPRQHLETVRRVFPRAKRVGVIFDAAHSGGYVREAAKAAADLGLTLEARQIERPGELSRRLEELRGRVDVVWLLPDPTVLAGENLSVLLLASFESRIPLYGFSRKYVELGAIGAAHLDPAALGAQAAGMLAALAPQATGPASARWDYARGARLVVNQRVARKMGLVLDPRLLETAADVLR